MPKNQGDRLISLFVILPSMAHRARIICVGIGWWVLGVLALFACLHFIWIAAARLGLVQVRSYGGWTAYSGRWADVIGFSELVALPLGIVGISITVITLSRRGRLPGAQDTRQQRGFAVERSKEAV